MFDACKGGKEFTRAYFAMLLRYFISSRNRMSRGPDEMRLGQSFTHRKTLQFGRCVMVTRLVDYYSEYTLSFNPHSGSDSQLRAPVRRHRTRHWPKYKRGILSLYREYSRNIRGRRYKQHSALRIFWFTATLLQYYNCTYGWTLAL